MLESPKGQLYTSLEKRILEQVPEIRYVALDIGQLDFYKERPAVSFPCLLLKFINIDFSDLSQNVQWANVSIGARLGFSPFTSASSLTPDIPKEKALQFFEIENKAYKALQGWAPTIEVDDEDVEICEPLTRTNSQEEQREDPFIVVAMNFSTAGEDDSARAATNKTAAGLNLTIETMW